MRTESEILDQSKLANQLPPCDIEAEARVLGCFMLGTPLDAVELTADDFYDEYHRKVFQALVAMHEAGKPTDDIQLLANELQATKDHNSVRLAEISHSVNNAAHIEHHAEIVADLGIKRRLFTFGLDAARAAQNGKPATDLIDEFGIRFDDLATKCHVNRGPHVVKGLEVKPTSVRWLWDSWLVRGQLNLLDGDPGVGKSTLTIDLAAKLSKGFPRPPHEGKAGTYDPIDVLLLSAEDDLSHTIRPRLDAAGADLDRIHILTGMPDGDHERPVSLPQDVAAVGRVAEDRKVGLIVIDPFMAFVGDGVNTHKDSDIRRCLYQLATVAERTDAAMLIVRHLNKDQGKSAKYRGGGSIGILGAARAAWLVGEDPNNDDTFILAMNKLNLAKKPSALRYQIRGSSNGSSCIKWVGQSDLTADEILPKSGEKTKRVSKADQCADLLRKLLADGPRDSSDIQDMCESMGFRESVFRQARKKLGVVSEKAAFDTGWQISLPEAVEETNAFDDFGPEDVDSTPSQTENSL